MPKLQLQELAEEENLAQLELVTIDSQIVKAITFEKPLKKELLSLKLEKAKLLALYGKGHRIIKTINSKIIEISKLISSHEENNANTTTVEANPRYFEIISRIHDIQTRKAVYNTRRRELEHNLISSNVKMAAAPELEMKFNQLLRKKASQMSMVTTLEQKFQESQLQKSATPREIFVIERAAVSQSPISNKKMGFWSIFALGIIVAIGVCMVVEYFDPTIRKSKDLQNKYGLEMLAVIPHEASNNPQILKHPDFEKIETHIEPYRRLLTNIFPQESQCPIKNKNLLVTSALQGEGKTTTSAFLATTSALKGERVLLIDADLRRSSIHKLFNLTNESGLSNYLSDEDDWQSMVHKTEIHNLSILTAGSYSLSLTQTVARKRLKNLLHMANRLYDFVIIDSPPILRLSDSLVLAPMVNSTLLVFRSEKTPFKACEELMRQLNYIQARVVGAILNDVSKTLWDKYYYSYYNYYDYEYYK